MPRADQCDGLVALASIVSKTVRELWMDVFNEYWRGRIPGLRPTAGYPSDAVPVPAGDRADRPRPRATIRRTGGASSRIRRRTERDRR